MTLLSKDAMGWKKTRTRIVLQVGFFEQSFVPAERRREASAEERGPESLRVLRDVSLSGWTEANLPLGSYKKERVLFYCFQSMRAPHRQCTSCYSTAQVSWGTTG
jgi:hypothetical protein